MPILNLAQGIGAALVTAAVLYLAGFVVLPQRWRSILISDGTCVDGAGPSPVHVFFGPRTGWGSPATGPAALRQHKCRPGFDGPLPLVVGAAIYTLTCWIAVSARAVPLVYVIAGFVIVVTIGASQRLTSILALLRAVNRKVFQWLAVFVGFYVISHFLLAPVTAGPSLRSPVAGRLELLTHAHHARLLLENGSSSISDAMFGVRQHPAVASVLAGYSMFFHRDPLAAAIPLQTAAAAATALLMMAMVRSTFALSYPTSAFVAFIAIAAPLYRSAASASLLPTLLGVPVVLYLLQTTLRANPQKTLSPIAATTFAAAYALLWLLDPLMLGVAILVQGTAIVLTGLDSEWDWQRAGRIAVNAILPLAVLALAFYQRAAATPALVMSYFRDVTTYQPLGLISPLALLGWPLTIPRMQAESTSRQAFGLAVYLALGAALWVAYRRPFADATPQQRTLARTTAVVFLAAIVSFLALGSSVAQWRLASMLLLPLAFVPVAVLAHVIQSAPSRLGLGTPDDVRLSRSALVYAAIAIVVANVAVSASARPPLGEPAAVWQQLEAVRKLGLPRVTVRLDEPSAESAALAQYYLAASRIDFIDPEAGLAPATLEAISPKDPLFVQGAGCAEVGHDDVVAVGDLGCLIMAPPSVVLDKGYSVESRFLFLAYEGLTARYGGGRLSSRDGVVLRITADPAKVGIEHDLHVNVLLNALVTAGAEPRRLHIVWPNSDSSDVDVQTREWISIPVRSGDWTGNRLWSVPLRFRVLDGRAILFEELSVTEQPAGRVLQRPSAHGQG